VLDVLQAARRQRLKLSLQPLDALAQLTKLRRGRRGRRRGLCACGAALLWRLARERPGAGHLGIVRAASACQLLDRKILVVALEHVPLHTRQ